MPGVAWDQKTRATAPKAKSMAAAPTANDAGAKDQGRAGHALRRTPGRTNPHRKEGDKWLLRRTGGVSKTRGSDCSTRRLYEGPPMNKGG